MRRAKGKNRNRKRSRQSRNLRTRSDTGLSVREDTGATMTIDDVMREYFGDGSRVRRPYTNSIICHTCILALAKTISQVPLRLLDNDDEVIDITDHEYNRLITMPDGINGMTAFLRRTLIHWNEDGIVHWIDLDLPNGERCIKVARRKEMSPVHPQGVLVGWTWRESDRASGKFIPIDKVATFRYDDPDDPFDGLPPHVPAAVAVRHHHQSMDFNLAALLNGGEVGTIYQTDQSLTPKQVKELRREIVARHIGASKHRQFAIAHSGLKIDRGTDALRDIDQLNGMRLDAELLGGIYGVTPIMRGDYTNATYSNAREQKLLFWEMTGLHILEALEDGANRLFLRGDQVNYKLEFFREAVPELQWRSIQYAAEAMKLSKHGIARNEINARWDLGLPDQDWGEEPLVGAGMLPISIVVGGAKEAYEADNQPEGDSEIDSGKRSGLAVRADSLISSTEELSRLIDQARHTIEADEEQARDDAEQSKVNQAIHTKWNKSWSGLRNVAVFRIRKFMKAQGKRLIKRLEAELEQRAEGDEYDDLIKRILVDFEKTEDELLSTVMEPVVSDGVELGGKQIERELEGSGFDFAIDSPAVKKHIQDQVIRVRDVNKTTVKRIRSVLKNGLKEGKGLAELGTEIENVMGADAKHRGYRIAQTEIHEALGAGRNEAMSQAGIEGKAWIDSGKPVRTTANPNGIVRPAHRYATMKTKVKPIRTDDNFVLFDPNADVAREEAPYPGYAGLSPGNRINCSCVSVPRTIEEKRSDDGFDYRTDEFLTYENMLRLRKIQ